MPRSRKYAYDFPLCPKCGLNDRVDFNGRDKETQGCPQKYLCYRCKRSGFRTEYKRKPIESYFAQAYRPARLFLYGKADQDVAAEMAELTVRKFRKVMLALFATFLPAFEEAKQRDLGRNCKVLGIDITIFKVNGEKRRYLKLINNLTSDLLYKAELSDDNPETVVSHLKKARTELHLNPILIVCDLGSDILSGINHAFQGIKIQACWFHLHKWLDTQLPTTNETGIQRETRDLFRQVKLQIMKCAICVDGPTRAALLEKLRSIDLTHDKLDKEGKHYMAKNTIDNFVKHCDAGYYNTPDVLFALAGTRSIRRLVYNNPIERSFRDPKSRSKKLRRWLSVYDDAFYHYKLEDRLKAAKERGNHPTANIVQGPPIPHLPLSFLLSYMPYLEVGAVTDTGHSAEHVLKVAKAIDALVTDNRMVGNPYMKKIKQYFKQRKSLPSALEISHIFYLSLELATHVISAHGFLLGLQKENMIAKPHALTVQTLQPSPIAGSTNSPKIQKELPAFTMPPYLQNAKMDNAFAIATVIYHLNDAYATTGDIAKLLTKTWKKIDLRNVSREVTSTGKILRQYIERSGLGNRGISFNSEGREWYRALILQRYGQLP